MLLGNGICLVLCLRLLYLERVDGEGLGGDDDGKLVAADGAGATHGDDGDGIVEGVVGIGIVTVEGGKGALAERLLLLQPIEVKRRLLRMTAGVIILTMASPFSLSMTALAKSPFWPSLPATALPSASTRGSTWVPLFIL